MMQHITVGTDKYITHDEGATFYRAKRDKYGQLVAIKNTKAIDGETLKAMIWGLPTD